MIYGLLIFLETLFYLYIRTKKNLQILQQNFYNENNRYLKWGLNNIFWVFNSDFIIFLISILNIYFKNNYLLLINIFYIISTIVTYKNLKKEQVKLPLKVTSRLKRLIVTITILYLLVIGFYFFNKSVYLFNLLYAFLITFNFYVIYFANIINKPIEKIVFLYYKNKAVKKIKRMDNLKVVGITGSYGKTSSKNILNDILSVKYNSITTPQNYNTQYGLIITINNYLDKFNDIFIAEMGAFKRGRIKLLCNLVKPKYGIITSIGTAHLETFGSRENIQKGKFELVESLPSDGLAILNKDDEWQRSYKIQNNVSVKWIGINNKEADVVAKNIKIDKNGMSFDVYFKDTKKTYPFRTNLLGNSNIYNILGGVTFSKYIMNMGIEDIIEGVRRIKTIPHRLELKKRGDVTIIDDAYNSNPVGSKMALDVLNLMDGLKVVVTPGMIELGEEEYNLNKQFGQFISEVADVVILVGKKQTEPILDGLLEKQYDINKIKVINDVKLAFDLIEEVKIKGRDTYILLENDLPDIFNEK